MRENLIDLYRFMVHPIVLAKGKRLFADGVDEMPVRVEDFHHRWSRVRDHDSVAGTR